VALVGANGSGKSTLLRHLNALLVPTFGDVWVDTWNTRDAIHLRDIRTRVGMVFQVPDSQIVATTVEDDVAFGPENLGLGREELQRRVDAALSVTGLEDLRARASHLLSAGQKQRLAIAGALAMRPSCLLLDEATTMLDPQGRRQFLDTIAGLHRSGMTIVAATHDMSEAALAERVVVLAEGQIALSGPVRSVLSQVDRLRGLQLDAPYPTLLAGELATCLDGFPTNLLTVRELVAALTRLSPLQTRTDSP
jgi:energy-coupling factor transporter ATPase